MDRQRETASLSLSLSIVLSSNTSVRINDPTCQRQAQLETKSLKMGAEDYSPPATDIITLTRHVLTEGFQRREQSAASGDLTILLSSLQTTCKFIESNVRKASLINL